MNSSRFGRFVGLLALAALAAFPLACSRVGSADKIATGKVLDRATVAKAFAAEDVPSLELSSLAYAEVNEQSITYLVSGFNDALFSAGVPKSEVTGRTGYDQRFQCTGFADFFAGYSCARLMGELWHSPLPVQRTAVFVAWFTPDNAPTDSLGFKIGHAINPVITQHGIRYIEPQTGARLSLSLTERRTMRARA